MGLEEINKKVPIQKQHEMDKLSHLLEIKTILDSLQIPFFLGYGLVLSAVRENRFIPQDGDIDIIIKYEDLEGKVDTLAKILEEHGHKDFMHPNINRLWCVKYINDYRSELDIYAYPKHEAWRYEVYNKMFALFPKELFERGKTIDFYGEKFKIPSPPEEYLRIVYGNSWRIPHVQPRGTIPHCRYYYKLPTVAELVKELEAEKDE